MTMTIKPHWAALALIAALLAAIVIFGMPARYSAPVSFGLSAIQLLVMSAAVASLVAPAWRSADERRRQIALTGVLLILPWALLTLMPGYGPPFASNLAMNHTRYIILFVSIAILGAAFFLLKEPLADHGGDRLFAPLGQASGVLAVSIQLVWAAILIGWTMTKAHKAAITTPMEGSPLANASDVLLFFAGLLTYVSTALYALSFSRRGWLGPQKARIMAVVAVVAVTGLVVRGLEYPDLGENWFTMPGMIIGIPAIPWLMPYLLGVCALVYAAEQRVIAGEHSLPRAGGRSTIVASS